MRTEKELINLTPEATINQIILSGQNASKLLKSIGMKPELFLDQTLRSVCQQLKWNEDEILNWINKRHNETECIMKNSIEPDFNEDLLQWCGWFSDSVQPCIRELSNDISRDLPRVQLVHGNQYTWLKNIEWHFKSLSDQINFYFSFISDSLFLQANEQTDQRRSVLIGKVNELEQAFEIMETNRPNIQEEMNKIRKFSDDFKHPDGACSTFRIMNKNLTDLFTQLDRYFTIEQEQLFPLIINEGILTKKKITKIKYYGQSINNTV